MIFVNGKLYNPGQFPDGTPALRFAPYSIEYTITWKYDSEAECMILWHLVHHLKAAHNMPSLTLRLPYIPNARMDRVKQADEVFTLKWFAEFLNTLGFDTVVVEDPHSSVATALIDHVVVHSIKPYVDKVFSTITPSGQEPALLCYPDEGAAKKYSDLFQGREYIFGIKHRDWRTGKIQGLSLNNAEAARGRTVLIVDDICARGGTAYYTAKELKANGAEKVYFYVTHCENSIFEGELLKTDFVDKIFTTDSIYRGDHEKIVVL